MQAVVDAKGKFIFVDIGDYGRNSDAGIFRNSVLLGKLLIKHKLYKDHHKAKQRHSFCVCW